MIDNIGGTGRVTSVKSRDLDCQTYQNGSKLEYTIKKDIDKLSDFELIDWGGKNLSGVDISGKRLQIVVTDTNLSSAQITAINNAIDYGKIAGVDLSIVVGG